MNRRPTSNWPAPIRPLTRRSKPATPHRGRRILALVAAIAVVELTYTAQRYIGSTYKPFEMFLLSGVLYMIMIYGVGKGISWLDRKARIT